MRRAKNFWQPYRSARRSIAFLDINLVRGGFLMLTSYQVGLPIAFLKLIGIQSPPRSAEWSVRTIR